MNRNSNRRLLGWTALALLAVGCLVAWQGPAGSGSAVAGPCIKAGLVLAALWLALPQITSFFTSVPRWLIAALGGAAVLCVFNPWLILLALPALPLLWFFAPRRQTPTSEPTDKPIAQKKRPRRRSTAT